MKHSETKELSAGTPGWTTNSESDTPWSQTAWTFTRGRMRFTVSLEDWTNLFLGNAHFDWSVFTDMMNYSHWKFNRKKLRDHKRGISKKPCPLSKAQRISGNFILKSRQASQVAWLDGARKTKSVAPNCLVPPPEGYIPWVALCPENCSHTYGSHATTGLLLGKDTKFLGWFG